jgi:hypothetical protein
MPEDAPMMTAVRVESLVMSTRNGVLKMRGMAMGKRKPERQPTMWMATTESRTAASHPFYTRLNHLLRERGFNDFAEAQC